MSRKHPLTDKFLCVWGSECGSDEDPHTCNEPAAGIVVVLDSGKRHALNVCLKHRQILIDETDPAGTARK